MRRFTRGLIVSLLILAGLLTGLQAFAAPSIEETEYKSGGIVEVEFHGKVQYKGVKATVKDPNGKAYTAKITKKDNDELTFKVSGIQPGTRYTYQISGIRKKGEKTYSTVSGSFAVPVARAPQIESVEYKKKRIEVEFKGKVQYKNLKATLKDASGKKYTAKISKKEDDELTIKTSSLPGGTAFTLTLSGIRAKGDGGYTALTGSFTTPRAGVPRIESVEYENKRIEVEFEDKVQYKNLKVTLKDAAGKSYTAKVSKKENDELTIKTDALPKGASFTVTLSGIRKKGAGQYVTLTGEFRTR